jgi:hypothetical protein
MVRPLGEVLQTIGGYGYLSPAQAGLFFVRPLELVPDTSAMAHEGNHTKLLSFRAPEWLKAPHSKCGDTPTSIGTKSHDRSIFPMPINTCRD